MEQMTCPICGCRFDYDLVEYLNNGNPACPSCVSEERRNEDE